MQGKGYILKRVYIERDLLREQKSHQQRLAEIKKKQVSVDVNPIDKQLKKSKLNHVKSTQFKELEENRKQQVVNSMLVRKLEDINKGKFSVARPLGQSQSMSQFKASQQTFKTSNSKSINTLGKGSLNNVGRRLEEERIARENHALAQRMINLPPVIQKKKQDKDFKKNKQLHNQILRFHHLKDKKEKKYGRRKFDKLVSDSSDDEFDPNDEELMNKKVQMVVHLKNIEFINFLPQNDQNEKYIMEVRASIKPLRTTNPETYEDFSQSVINEFFYLKELKKSKLVYMAIHQIKNGKKQFLGDFELDLSPYYKETCFHLIHFDLRNYKELRNSPSYIHKDMRKKGNIDFELQVHSNIKNFNLERQADKEAAKQAQNDLDQIYQQQQQNQQEKQKEQQDQQKAQTQQV